jgi:hypothetical protein
MKKQLAKKEKKKKKEKLDSVFLAGAPFPALGLRVRRAVSRSLRQVLLLAAVVAQCFPHASVVSSHSSSPSYLPSLSSTTTNSSTIAATFFLLISCKDWHLHCS